MYGTEKNNSFSDLKLVELRSTYIDLEFTGMLALMGIKEPRLFLSCNQEKVPHLLLNSVLDG